MQVSKARKLLTCALCKQKYGACIQCNGGSKCCTAFHPLCARNAGWSMVACPPEGEEEANEAVGGGGGEGGGAACLCTVVLVHVIGCVSDCPYL